MRSLLLSALLLSSAAGASAQFQRVAVYGGDHRRDLYQVGEPGILELADSVAGLFHEDQVSFSEGKALLHLAPYGARYGLCREEPFFSQPHGPFATGFLVAPQVLLTAGHSVGSEEGCRKTRFVFGFALHREDQRLDAVDEGQVYGCSRLLGRRYERNGGDWALVLLDRPVAGRKPLALGLAGDPTEGTPLFIIGHPGGLPLKVAGGGRVRSVSPRGYFTASLDAFVANSGSPVFNAATRRVEGILVDGEDSFVPGDPLRGDSCQVTFHCPMDGCRGETATSISAVDFSAVALPSRLDAERFKRLETDLPGAIRRFLGPI